MDKRGWYLADVIVLLSKGAAVVECYPQPPLLFNTYSKLFLNHKVFTFLFTHRLV
ncbi:Uncharacterised protein [Serratia quinivorans]|uniref:Uncharacterized protein n=1 Tax=Serratia quinivorans TaxID=137545 RepID=A0A379YZ89_9GAMM|nr:Uncharacterised protein [Serratia quinivorans]